MLAGCAAQPVAHNPLAMWTPSPYFGARRAMLIVLDFTESKVDPGPLFPWQRLADAGFGRWPRTKADEPPAEFDPWLALSDLGYPIENRAAAVVPFHHHFRGIESDVLDDEDTHILPALTREPR